MNNLSDSLNHENMEFISRDNFLMYSSLENNLKKDPFPKLIFLCLTVLNLNLSTWVYLYVSIKSVQNHT